MKCVKAMDVDSWSLRPSHSSNNWQLHVHVKRFVHCGSPCGLEAVVSDGADSEPDAGTGSEGTGGETRT